MQLAMNIRNWGRHATPTFLRACAEAADRSGLDAIWFNDHIGLPPTVKDNTYSIPDDMGAILDPLGFAHWLAAVTTRVRFGPAVLVLPYRPALVTAKLIATVQVLSSGRFLLGIGPGYLAEEFSALGVPLTQRGAITDDVLRVLHAAARDGLVERHGQHLRLEPRAALPPIFVGGGAVAAIPRAVALADGWMPVGLTPDALAAPIAELTSRARDAGREPLAVVAMKTLPLDDPPAAAAMARAFRDVGVTQLVHTQGYDSPAHYAEIVEQIDREIRATIS